MFTLSAALTFYIPQSTSLKDKRQVCRSIIDKGQQRFNASISEVDTQDIHQTMTLGVAVVSGEYSHAREMLDDIVRYMERNTEAELISVQWSE